MGLWFVSRAGRRRTAEVAWKRGAAVAGRLLAPAALAGGLVGLTATVAAADALPTAPAGLTATLNGTVSVNGAPVTGSSSVTVDSSSALSQAGTTVQLSWTAGGGQTGFSVWRWENAPQVWTKLTNTGPLSATATTYTDTPPATFPTGPRHYAVCALNQAGSACSRASVLRPGQPQNLAAALNVSLAVNGSPLTGSGTQSVGSSDTISQAGTTVTLTWSALNDASNAAHVGYGILRFTPGSGWTRIAIAGPAATSYTDSAPGSFPAGHINYHVCAFDLMGSTCSSSVAVVRPAAPALPATGVAVDNSGIASSGWESVDTANTNHHSLAQTVLSGARVNLAWTAGSGSGTLAGFSIYRWDTSSSSWLRVGVAGPGATSFTDTPPASSHQAQHYHICAFNLTGGHCSSAVTVGRPLTPNMPVTLTAGTSSVSMSWTEPSNPSTNAPLGYGLFRWNGSASTWVRMAMLPVSSLSNLSPSLSTTLAGGESLSSCSGLSCVDNHPPGVSGSTHYYSICAFNAFGASCTGAQGMVL